MENACLSLDPRSQTLQYKSCLFLFTFSPHSFSRNIKIITYRSYVPKRRQVAQMFPSAPRRGICCPKLQFLCLFPISQSLLKVSNVQGEYERCLEMRSDEAMSIVLPQYSAASQQSCHDYAGDWKFSRMWPSPVLYDTLRCASIRITPHFSPSHFPYSTHSTRKQKSCRHCKDVPKFKRSAAWRLLLSSRESRTRKICHKTTCPRIVLSPSKSTHRLHPLPLLTSLQNSKNRILIPPLH
jgi:hypothetical protein